MKKSKIFAVLFTLGAVCVSQARAALFEIESVSAHRANEQGKKYIAVVARLKNTSKETISGGTYSFSRWDGKSWVTLVASGAIPPTAPGQAVSVKTEAPFTFEEQRYSFGHGKSKEATLPEATPNLELLSLKCVDTDDDSGADRIELRVTMGRLDRDYKLEKVMRTGETWNINQKPKPMRRDVTVEIWEIDPEAFDKDDKLGVVRIRRDDWGEVKVVKIRNKDSWYELKYRVTAITTAP